MTHRWKYVKILIRMSSIMMRTDAKMKKDEINSLQIGSARDTMNHDLLWKRIVGVLLILHGILCVVGALFPIHPVLVIFYMLVHVNAAIKISLTLILAAVQLVFGGYLTLNWQVRWYWPAIITVSMGIIIAIAVPLVLASFCPYI